MEILNQDIKHAVEANIFSEYWGDLNPSVMGQTYWSASEKEMFFAGLERLGRLDLAGIASRIGTKNEEEVRLYLHILEQEDCIRRSDPGKRERVIRTLDVPPAAEVSQETCNALERIADDISLRCERQEDVLEQKRWGRDRWLVTAELAKTLEHRVRRQDKDSSDPPFAEFLKVRNWLELSDRVFMNSAVPDYNWRFASHEAPSIRASALQDLHGLATEVTKRLVTATLVKAAERVDAKSREHRTRRLVKTKDVRQAAAALGLKENSRDFWARSARRLRLEVHGDENGPESAAEEDFSENETTALSDGVSDDSVDDDDDDNYDYNDDDDGDDENSDEQNIMTYREVEAALGIHATDPRHDEDESDTDDVKDLSDTSSLAYEDSSSEESIQDDSEEEQTKSPPDIPGKNQDTDSSISGPEMKPGSDDIDPAEVDRDLHEAIQYTDISYSGTSRGRDAIRRRLEAEHRLEAQCARSDALLDRVEERRLRRLLRDHGDGGGSAAKSSGDKSADAALRPQVGVGRGGGPMAGETLASWTDAVEFRPEWEFNRRYARPRGDS